MKQPCICLQRRCTTVAGRIVNKLSLNSVVVVYIPPRNAVHIFVNKDVRIPGTNLINLNRQLVVQ